MPEKISEKKLKETLKEIVGPELLDDALYIVEKTVDWYADFLNSKDFENLSKKQKKIAEAVVVDFLGLNFYNHKITPEKWNEETLENYCFEILPEERFQQTEEYYKSVPIILFYFFNFLAENKLLLNAKVLAEKVQKMGPDFIKSFRMIESNFYDYVDSEELLDEVYEWFLAFEKSEFYQKLSESEQSLSEEIVLNFTDFMFGFHQVVPEDWTEEILEECCVNTLPANLPVTEIVFNAFYPVLSNFFYFLDDVKILKNGDSLAKRLKKIDGKMRKNAADPTVWKIEKVMIMQAIAAGIDINNEKLMKKFFDKFSKKIAGEFSLEEDDEIDTIENEPFKLQQQKIGRNEPCPCGSGKKYKKCHGAAA